MIGSLVSRRARAFAALIIAVLGGAAGVAFREEAPFSTLEGLALDARFALRGELPPGRDVVLLAIDDASIAALGGWPLPRAWLARAATALAEAGARAVVFDLLLLNPSGDSSPASSVDAVAAAFAEADNVVLPFAFTFTAPGEKAGGTPEALRRSAYTLVREAGGADSRQLLRPTGIVAPAEPLLEAADAGHASVILDAGRSLRFDHVALAYEEQVYPSIAVVAVMRALGLTRDDLVADIGRGIRIGDLTIGTDSHMRLAVNHYGPQGSFPTHPFIGLIDGTVAADAFRDRIVVVGATGTGVGDAFASPFTAQLPGLEYFATVIDNILTERWLVRADWVVALDFLVILALGLACAMIARIDRVWAVSLGMATLLVAVVALHTAAFALASLWLNLVFPILTLLLIAAWSIFAAALHAQRLGEAAARQRDRLTRYVGRSVAARLVDGGGDPGDPRTQFASVLFVDIAGFTGLSERMPPADVHTLLREFQRIVERTAEAHDGVIDKFIGDGAMLIFGLDDPGPEDPANALACARALASEIEAWRPDPPSEGRPAISVGIGLHHGPVVAGETGGEHQVQFTVTGDAVNVASRLQDLTREHRVVILASDTVIEAARAVGGEGAVAGLRPLPLQEIRGRARPIGVWAWPG